jgi:hypothetical protein
VISKTVNLDGDVPKIEVALIGEPIMPQVIENIKAKMKLNERLDGAELVVRQGAIKEEGLDMATVQLMNQNMKSGIIEDLYKRNEEVLQSKEERINTLEKEIVRLRSRELPIGDISRELHASYDNVREFTLMKNPVFTADSMRLDTVMFAYVKFNGRVSQEEKTRLSNWLQVRTKCDSLRLVLE